MDQDETWHGGRPRSWPHCVRWKSSSPSSKGAQSPVSAHVCCGQTAGWIKMPLGREVGIGPGDIVLDLDPAPPPPKWHNPNFRLSVVAKRFDGSRCHLVGIRYRPWPWSHCVRWGASFLSPNGHGYSPPSSVHIYCGQTVAPSRLLLSTCSFKVTYRPICIH